MIVLNPTAAVYTRPIENRAEVLRYQERVQSVIPATNGLSSCLCVLGESAAFIFTQDSKELVVPYIARGRVSRVAKTSPKFPIHLLEEMFGSDYTTVIHSLIGKSELSEDGDIYVSIVDLAGTFYFKFIRTDEMRGSIRSFASPDFQFVCNKTSLYMDKAFAKGLTFPEAKMTKEQSVFVSHVFNCLYAQDILTNLSRTKRTVTRTDLRAWSGAGWIDEYINLAQMSGVSLREYVDKLAERKLRVRCGEEKYPIGDCNGIYPVDTFSLEFDATYNKPRKNRNSKNT